jgi:glycosyltransferase involved in cell wall biosynthesis
MHIVQILPELNQGGVERGVVEFSRELVKRGHTSTVISAGGQLAARIEQEGGTHIQLDVCSKNPLTFFFRFRKLQTAISKLSPDILHARSRVPAWLCRFANRKTNIPFVTTVHGFNSVSKYSEIMTKGDRVICVSNPIKAFIREQYGTPNEKITVIHRGIDPAEFDPGRLDRSWMDAFRAEHNMENRFIASSIGRITELKDYETFIRAVKKASENNHGIIGLIVGGVRHDKQAYFERLQSLVASLQAEDRIVFAGSQERMPEIYALSDVLISCSKKPESFGRTLIEAMAMGTPVIATRHGGAMDIIENGRNGFLFDPGDDAGLAQHIGGIDRIDRAALRPYVADRFSLEKMVESAITVYRELLEERNNKKTGHSD